MLVTGWLGLVRLTKPISMVMIKLMLLLTQVVGMLILMPLTDVRAYLRLVILGTLLCMISIGSSFRSPVLSLIMMTMVVLLLILRFGLLAACPKDAKLPGPLEMLLGFPGLIISGLVDGKGGQTFVSLSKTWLSGPFVLGL